MSENTTANQPQVIGQLSEEEMGQITSLKEVASRHLSEIGQLELRKNRLVMTLERNEQQAQTILVTRVVTDKLGHKVVFSYLYPPL